jgi:hypothetical protein
MNMNRSVLGIAIIGCMGTVLFASLWIYQRQAARRATPELGSAVTSRVPRQNDLRQQLQAALKEARQARDDAAVWRIRAESLEHKAPPTPSGPLVSVNNDTPDRTALKSLLLRLVTHPNEVSVERLTQLGIAPDSADFLAMAAALPNDHTRFAAIFRLLDLWVKSDPDGALAWLKTMEDDKNYQSIAVGFARKFFHADGTRGERWLATQPKGRLRDALIREFIIAVADDPQRATSWYAQLDNPQSQRDIAGKIARHWWQKDAQAAAEWVARLPDAQTRQMAVREVAMRGITVDIDATLAWCEAMMDEQTFENVFPNVVSRLANSDLDTAADLVNDLPAGTVRDRSIQQTVGVIARTDPKLAAEWAITIDDANQRLGALRQVAYQWGRADANAAEAWLAASPLDAPAKQTLAEIVTRMRAQRPWGRGNQR